MRRREGAAVACFARGCAGLCGVERRGRGHGAVQGERGVDEGAVWGDFCKHF